MCFNVQRARKGFDLLGGIGAAAWNGGAYGYDVTMITAATHTPDGKFAKGNKLGGNPVASARNKWVQEWRKAATVDDLLAVWAKVVDQAKAGEPWACQEVLNRMLGKSAPPVFEDQDSGKLEITVKHVDKHLIPIDAESRDVG